MQMKIREVVSGSTNTRRDMAINAIFGKLKANIDFSFVGMKNLCLMITSSLPDEGKTTISANIAAAMASSGKKTLLLDADMRNASVHLMFNYVNSQGLSDIISQNSDWRQIIIKSNIPNLYIITAGRKPLNPAKFVSSQQFKSILDDVKKEFDYVVVDTPPILLVSDSQIISPLVDGVILVVNSGKTMSAELKNASETLKRANANLIGAVLNNVKSKGGAYGYGYGYGEGKQKSYRAAAAKPTKMAKLMEKK